MNLLYCLLRILCDIHASGRRASLYSEIHQHPDKPVRQLYDEVLEQIVHADRVGFDCYSIIEHYFFPQFSASANPRVMFAKASERTRHINFRTMGHPLPYHNPVVLSPLIQDGLPGTPEELAAARFDFYASGILEQLAATPYDRMIEDDIIWVGTPADVIERIETVKSKCDGLTEVAITVNAGGIEHWKAIKAQQLFAESVMPHFR